MQALPASRFDGDPITGIEGSLDPNDGRPRFCIVATTPTTKARRGYRKGRKAWRHGSGEWKKEIDETVILPDERVFCDLFVWAISS